MKALSLPINAVVVIILAVFVFLVASALFIGSSNQNMKSISDQEALLNGCAMWRERGCDYATVIGEIKVQGYDSRRSEKDVSYKGTLKEACVAMLMNGEFAETDDKIKNTCYNYCCSR
ncbi:MAG: hypothetical protein HZB66_03155 [Candidatus Aenigmarchaeota archaeon]|nr:hypothetical protein [Candidatus Aenigmarchaeota archaeon]